MRSTGVHDDRGEVPTTLRHLAVVVLLSAAPVHAVFVHIDAPAASPGETVGFAVSLNGEGDEVASLAVDVGFEPTTPIRASGQRPDCRVEEEIRKPSSAFAYRPGRCTVGVDCSAVRAGVVSFDLDTAKLPIPDGPLFVCRLTVPPATPIGERIELDVLHASAIDPGDREIDVTAASRGDFIEVVPRPACAGDCDRDGVVAIDELARAVAIGLGESADSGCPGLSRDDDAGVSVDDVIAAVVNAGIGCPSASRPR